MSGVSKYINPDGEYAIDDDSYVFWSDKFCYGEIDNIHDFAAKFNVAITTSMGKRLQADRKRIRKIESLIETNSHDSILSTVEAKLALHEKQIAIMGKQAMYDTATFLKREAENLLTTGSFKTKSKMSIKEFFEMIRLINNDPTVVTSTINRNLNINSEVRTENSKLTDILNDIIASEKMSTQFDKNSRNLKNAFPETFSDVNIDE